MYADIVGWTLYYYTDETCKDHTTIPVFLCQPPHYKLSILEKHQKDISDMQHSIYTILSIL